MEPFTKFTGLACPFDQINVDTNQICPTRFNKLSINDPYLSKVMFHDHRFTRDGLIKNPTSANSLSIFLAPLRLEKMMGTHRHASE